ncbi:hypothetical protein NQ318_002454, partial [Aromia moschata]
RQWATAEVKLGILAKGLYRRSNGFTLSQGRNPPDSATSSRCSQKGTPAKKLRPTNNGEILHSGGTISGRQNRLPLEINNGNRVHYIDIRHIKIQQKPIGSDIVYENSIESACPTGLQRAQSSNQDLFFPTKETPLHKSRSQISHRHNATSQKGLQDQMKLFVSEPDLRYVSPTVQNMQEKKSKKKYKAPPPPQNFRMNEKLEWEENSSDTDFPTRKPRLFKTRAETKKNSSHVNKPQNDEYTEGNNNPKNEPHLNARPKRLSLPEFQLATNDDFQRELKEATKRLRHIQADVNNKNTKNYEPSNKSYANNKDKLKTLDHNVGKTENVRKKIKDMVEIDDNKNIIHCPRGEASGKESSTPETSPNLIMKDIKSREQPKTFYFGMDEPGRTDVVDHFAANLHQINKIPNSSESDISSDMDSDENNISKIGIDLQLRPILPKKQLEIPRFSPAAAWKLLSTLETIETTVTTVNDDPPVFIEERIEKFSRPPPPPSVQVGQRSTHDKSGDSGISGDDAIPTACYDDNPENGIVIPGPTTSCVNTQERVSWTPQQDLGDDSSIERAPINHMTHSGPHLFSLSLPRDNQLSAYMVEKSSLQYSGLEKIKRSVSGVLNTLSNKKDIIQANLTDEESVNWFLSKSAPNSLSNGFHSLEVRKSQESDQVYPPGMNKTSRVMYLPEAEHNNYDAMKQKEGKENNPTDHKFKLSVYSKSCEDITTAIKTAPEALQDLPVNEENPWKPTRKPKKFTFQSTIRQIEKKRLSDKLSREAERREKKRLRELEAMQRVEEEFQKKRAREKASIRQQLRLYCMDEDSPWSSLPPNLEIKNEVRPEPDGAISSSTTSSSPLPAVKSNDNTPFLKYNAVLDLKENGNIRPPATQELSEYRQIQRDYKEYRGSAKYTSDGRYSKQT